MREELFSPPISWAGEHNVFRHPRKAMAKRTWKSTQVCTNGIWHFVWPLALTLVSKSTHVWAPDASQSKLIASHYSVYAHNLRLFATHVNLCTSRRGHPLQVPTQVLVLQIGQGFQCTTRHAIEKASDIFRPNPVYERVNLKPTSQFVEMDDFLVGKWISLIWV